MTQAVVAVHKMSLYKFSQFANAQNKLHRPYRAEVVDNNDPSKLGKVKIKIPGLIEGDNSKLPWAYPQNPYAFGGHPKSAAFHAPRVGSLLTVVFPYGNVYNLFYTGYWHSQNNYAMDPFKTNYPNRYGFVDPTGNTLVHDMTTHDITYQHVAQDDNQSSDPVNTGGDETADAGGPTSFTAPHILKDSSTVPPKFTINVNKDGSLNLQSLKDLISQFQGDAHLTNQGSQNFISQAKTLIQAVEHITHRAQKIFLN